MIFIEYENVMVKELDFGPFNHDNTITITFKRDDCRSSVGDQQTPQWAQSLSRWMRRPATI